MQAGLRKLLGQILPTKPPISIPSPITQLRRILNDQLQKLVEHLKEPFKNRKNVSHVEINATFLE
jgi:hypothetical protein